MSGLIRMSVDLVIDDGVDVRNTDIFAAITEEAAPLTQVAPALERRLNVRVRALNVQVRNIEYDVPTSSK